MNRTADRRQIDQSPDPAELFPGEAKAMAPLGLPGLVPGKREVDLYVRTYMTLLQSSGAISVSSLEPAHLTAASSLHAGAAEPGPDLSALVYSTQRLPSCITAVRDIVLGQSAAAFSRAGFAAMSDWRMVSAPGRRRRWLYDGDATLAAYIASASDLDDLVPTIVAYQIEWNKMHRIIAGDPDLVALIAHASAETPSVALVTETGDRLKLSPADWNRLRGVWGDDTWPNLAAIATSRKRYTLRMLSGSFLGYARATRQWWAPAARLLDHLDIANR
ncbi:MAG: hypothetical protein H0V24_11865, partial [Chloroflexia bacterium]|nr:hypothetical protein [Chloroflexia bacterium]